MDSYPDARLLDSAGATERLSELPLGRFRTDARQHPRTPVQSGDFESLSDSMNHNRENRGANERLRKTLGFTGFDDVELKRFELSTSALRTQRSPS